MMATAEHAAPQHARISLNYSQALNYSRALDKLLSLTDLERVSGQATHTRRYDLSRVRVLLERLGSPHLGTPTVHITGTKGKGSTAAMVSSVLSAQGYTPGLFTSPHLHTFRERIQLDGQPVSEAEFTTLVESVWPELEAINRDGSHGDVTTFELLTAMAFLHFRRSNAGFQVIEVGLGGRLDSTNLVEPRVCVITSISLDHTSILGDTVERIARDKAGIIKRGCVVVTSPQVPEVMKVLKDACGEQSVPLIQAARECVVTREAFDLDGQTFSVASSRGGSRLQIPLLGAHQLENAATALATLQALKEMGFAITDDSITRGFSSVSWPGRLEVLLRSPILVADGAHNPYSMGKLRQALRDYFIFQRLVWVVGVASDKNVPGIISEIAADAHLVVTTRSRHPRAMPSLDLAKALHRLGVEARAVDGLDNAVQEGLAKANAGDLVVVSGSLFVAAEAREMVLGIQPELYPTIMR